MIFVVKGVAFPSMVTLLSAWAPPLERSRMTAFVYSGNEVSRRHKIFECFHVVALAIFADAGLYFLSISV